MEISPRKPHLFNNWIMPDVDLLCNRGICSAKIFDDSMGIIIEIVQIWGSLQTHRSINDITGVCPTIGTTDFGLPRIVEMWYEE